MLEVEIEQRTLREARSEIEAELGDITVEVEAAPSDDLGGRGGRAGAAPSGSLATDGAGEAAAIASATNELVDIEEKQLRLLRRMVGDGFEAERAEGGDGGLLGGRLGTLGIGAMIGGGGLGGGLGGLLSGGLSRAVPSTTAGGVLGGIGLGLGGTNLLDRLGVMEGAEGMGRQARQDLPFGEQLGDASQFIPGQSGAAALPGIGQMVFGGSPDGPDQGMIGNRVQGAERAWSDFTQTWENRMDVADSLAEGLGLGEGLSSATSVENIEQRMNQMATGAVVDDPLRDPRVSDEGIRAMAQEGDTLRESTDLALEAARFGGRTSPTRGQAPPPGVQEAATRTASNAPGAGAAGMQDVIAAIERLGDQLDLSLSVEQQNEITAELDRLEREFQDPLDDLEGRIEDVIEDFQDVARGS